MDTKQFIISKVTNSLLTIIIVGGIILFLNYRIEGYLKDKEKKYAIEISKLEEKVSELHRFIDSKIVQAQHRLVTEKQLKDELTTIINENKELKKYIEGNNEELKRSLKADFIFSNQSGAGQGNVVNGTSYTFSDNYIDFNANLDTSLANYIIKLQNIPLELTVIQTELPDGKFKLNDYVLLKRKDTGEEFFVKNSVASETMNKENKLRYNLTSLVGFDFNTGNEDSTDINANIGISLFSYGKTTNPKWVDYRLLNLGFSGNEDNFGVYLVPVTWNAGRAIPFIQEAQIGPGIFYNLMDNKSYFMFGLLHNF